MKTSPIYKIYVYNIQSLSDISIIIKERCQAEFLANAVLFTAQSRKNEAQ